MEYTIRNHKLVGVDFIPSPNISSGTISPSFIVNHYTAGYDDSGAINTFKNPASKVSAQLIIDRDGTVTQMVAFNRRAWHAGPSRYKGYTGLNSHSIGIEFDNIGYVRKAADGGFVDYRGKKFVPDEGQEMTAAAHPRVGSGMLYWPSYTDIQLQAGIDVTKAIIAKYDIKDIVTHEEIDTRGWKTDVGPAFPQQTFKNLLRNESDDSPNQGVYHTVTASSLNVRSGAGTQWPKFDSLLRGTRVRVNEFAGDWAFVTLPDDEQGWVAHRYLGQS